VATTSPYRQPPPQKEARDDPTEQGGPADQDASSPLLPNPAADQDQQNDHGQQRQEGNVVERKVTNVAAVTSVIICHPLFLISFIFTN
jgi:hypothetical protein